MFKPTYLYVKTHNKTGLKYFGKTTAKDPYKYNGSGVRWKRHLHKHGVDLTTEIIGYFTDKEECLTAAIRFSKENDIVKSKKWANLKEESLDGGFDYINEQGLNWKNNNYFSDNNLRKQIGSISGKKQRDNKIGIFSLSYEESCQNLKVARAKLKEILGVDSIFSILNKDKEFNENKKKIFKEIKHQQGEKNSQFGTMWICNLELRENKKIKSNEQIPEGWIKGRKMFK